MHESFTFWFPGFWMILGAVFTVLGTLLAFVVVTKPDLFPSPRSNQVLLEAVEAARCAYDPKPLEDMKRDIEALRTAWAPP
jgi:hypothetical protein